MEAAWANRPPRVPRSIIPTPGFERKARPAVPSSLGPEADHLTGSVDPVSATEFTRLERAEIVGRAIREDAAWL